MARTDANPPMMPYTDEYQLVEVDADYLTKAVKPKQFIHIDQTECIMCEGCVDICPWKCIHMVTPDAIVEATGIGSLQLGRSNWSVWLTFVYLWLPFTLLPIYAAIERLPDSLLEASNDLGARGWTTFRRVMFPLILPGIAAGSIFAFSLTLGDYITPELVGGTSGVFISNRIAYHISSSLNWGLAAALATLLLLVVLVFYYTYDRIVGIDNVKLG